MRGHIVKRYKGSYTVVLNMGKDPATGKRKQQWVSVKGTKKDAEKRLSEMLHQIDTGAFMKPGKTTLAEFLGRWLTEYAQPNLSPRTVEGYESIIRKHLVPGLGNTPLTQIKPEHLRRYYSEKLSGGRCDGRGGLSPRSVRYHHVTLHCALRTAVKWGLLQRNPADGVDPPRCQRPEIHVMSEDDVQTFLEAIKDNPHYALFHLALFTGMRRSELLALRWCDVDLLLCQVHVTRSLHHLRNGEIVFRPTKTAKGRRMISLPPSAVKVLAEHQEKQSIMRLILGTRLGENDLVFAQNDGKPLLPDTVSHVWVKLVRRLGWANIRLHDARHTHASIFLKLGVHPKIVQERLGHASIGTTLDLYSHVAPGLQEAAALKFDQLLTPKRQNGVVEEVG